MPARCVFAPPIWNDFELMPRTRQQTHITVANAGAHWNFPVRSCLHCCQITLKSMFNIKQWKVLCSAYYLSLMQVGLLCQELPQGKRAPPDACRNRLVPLPVGSDTDPCRCCRTKRSKLDSTPTPDTSDVDLQIPKLCGLQMVTGVMG